jgi:hypothetical protein
MRDLDLTYGGDGSGIQCAWIPWDVPDHVHNPVDWNLPQHREQLFIPAVARKDLATKDRGPLNASLLCAPVSTIDGVC